MKNLAALITLFCLALPLEAQTQFVGRDYFPAELEFRELRSVQSERTIEAPAVLSKVDGGDLITEAGFHRYAQRVYGVGGGLLSVEVVNLKDAKAAYSLLTLLRISVIKTGPPGDWVSASDTGVLFARGNFLGRIQGSAPADLQRRVALSVSNRIGEREQAQIPLVIQLAEQKGYDPGSLRYFLGPLAFSRFGKPFGGGQLEFRQDMEVMQAGYSLGAQTGELTVISFPTNQLSQDYFDSVAGRLEAASQPRGKIYTRRAGPLLGFLDGDFDPASADSILGAIHYKYSIKWIYDKNNRASGTVLGIPMGILGTVVRSLVLTALLCGASLLLGVGFAVFRVLMRGWAPNNFMDRPERNEIIRLKLDEN